MLKLGMKPVTGVSRVTVKKSKNVSSLTYLFTDTNFSLSRLLLNWSKLTCFSFVFLDPFCYLKTGCFQKSNF